MGTHVTRSTGLARRAPRSMLFEILDVADTGTLARLNAPLSLIQRLGYRWPLSSVLYKKGAGIGFKWLKPDLKWTEETAPGSLWLVSHQDISSGNSSFYEPLMWWLLTVITLM